MPSENNSSQRSARGRPRSSPPFDPNKPRKPRGAASPKKLLKYYRQLIQYCKEKIDLNQYTEFHQRELIEASTQAAQISIQIQSSFSTPVEGNTAIQEDEPAHGNNTAIIPGEVVSTETPEVSTETYNPQESESTLPPEVGSEATEAESQQNADFVPTEQDNEVREPSIPQTSSNILEIPSLDNRTPESNNQQTQPTTTTFEKKNPS